MEGIFNLVSWLVVAYLCYAWWHLCWLISVL